MKPIVTLILVTLTLFTVAGCSSDSESGDGNGANTPSTGQTPDFGDGPTTVQIVITNDAALIDLEDEELSPILQRIEPQIENRLASSAISGADVQFIAPRSIVIQIEGEADVIVPQVQQIIADGDFEIPLSVTLLQSQ
jgi:uncharacterized lipoprotein